MLFRLPAHAKPRTASELDRPASMSELSGQLDGLPVPRALKFIIETNECCAASLVTGIIVEPDSD